MEWNDLKAQTSWDLSELEQESYVQTRSEFSVDLKLGQVGNKLAVNKVKMPVKATKRSRGSYGGPQVASCLVDGCTDDLSACRDYHRRHKVCELHSKTPQVTIGGHNQRFCQQCSRFHALEEFDEGKRSCRKRLDGHNRRRRKPLPEPFSRYGTLLPNYQGTQLLPFSSSLVYPSSVATSVGLSWPTGGRVVKNEAVFHPPGLQITQLPFSEREFPLFHKNNPDQQHNLLPRSFPFHAKLTSSTTTSSSTTSLHVRNSECALSLLSPPSITSEMGLGHFNDNNDNNGGNDNDNDNDNDNNDTYGSLMFHHHNHNHQRYHRMGSDGTLNTESHQINPSHHWGQV